ncbi:uncharacterized protein LOC112092198 [Morus notabilis]|uniref:uncharacterized protein LOC112092198 n=1 Tax=Morus notabilis TaxID=981085 RepID=UPI000CED3F12|nr:uncharacterized protein LOC112092198 [Morus notabilis]
MAAYLKKVREALGKFTTYDIQQVPRAKNSNADALARLAPSRDTDLLNLVPLEVLKTPSTEKRPEVAPVDLQPSWMDPIIRYMVSGELPEDRRQAQKMKYHAVRYTMHDNLLYRRWYLTPLLRCLSAEEAKIVFSEVHDGVCGNHAGGQSLAYKILRQGYCWPSLKKDAAEYAKRCESCQRFGVPHSLVSDNGKQFNNDNTSQFCKSLGIHNNFSSVVYPQSNGQVKAVNKIITVTLKRRLDAYKGKWADELPKVLWAYRTTSRTTTGETPFSMAYRFEVVLPIEVSIPTDRVTWYEEDRNAKLVNLELDLLEE